MKNTTIIFICTFLCQVGFSQINSLKIEAFTRGFTKEVELLDIGIKYKLKKSWKPEMTLIDTIILITSLQKDTLQFLGKNIDFSGLKTWKGSTKNSSVDGDYYSYLTINGIKSSYYDFRTGFKEIELFYRYFLKMLNEKVLYRKKQQNNVRYYHLALQVKFETITDLYDFEMKKTGTNINYSANENPFLLEKASEFRKDGYK